MIFERAAFPEPKGHGGRKMNKDRNRKEDRSIGDGWKKLSIRNHVIFGLVMRRPKLAKKCLERILGRTIRELNYIEAEKTEEVSAATRGIRVDIYCEDDETLYNVEMQAFEVRDLPKRSRYYQDMMDMILLQKGEPYRELKQNIVIFICTFDLFGIGRHIYTFENRCIQDPELRLDDGTTKIFLNTKGILEDIPRPLKLLLDYIETGKAEDAYTRELDDAVAEVRNDDKWREPIMTVEMMLEDCAYDAREKGREEGRAEGREEGRAEGREEGRAEGTASEKKNTVLRMLAAGKEVEDIMLATELDRTESNT